MQVRKGHSKIYQQDIIDVLDKQLLEGMGVLITEEEQQKCEENVCIFFGVAYKNDFYYILLLKLISSCNRCLLRRRDYLQYMKLAIYCWHTYFLDLIGMHFLSFFLVARYNFWLQLYRVLKYKAFIWDPLTLPLTHLSRKLQYLFFTLEKIWLTKVIQPLAT